MTNRILMLVLLMLVAGVGFAQQKPKPPVSKTVKKPVKAPPKKSSVPKRSVDTEKTRDRKSSAETAAPAREILVEDTYGQEKESIEQLRKLEAQNSALLSNEGEQAVFYRMNRSSITVLPVELHVPGLHERNQETGKYVYSPRQLYQAMSLRKHTGDLIVSEKHFQNRVEFDTHQMFAELFRDTTNFYAFIGREPELPQQVISEEGFKGIKNQFKELIPPKKPKDKPKPKPIKGGDQAPSPFDEKIRDYLTRNNVGTDVLKIWTNRSVLMERIYYSLEESDTRQRVDPKKLNVFEKLLRQNYVLVLVVVNPEKKVNYTQNGDPLETYTAGAQGYLFRVDTTRLNINSIQDRHPLKFVRQVYLPSADCDPRSEEFMEALGGSSIAEFRQNVNWLLATTIRKQAQMFYQNKDFACARNYYQYVIRSGLMPEESVRIKALINECDRQLSLSKNSSDSRGCQVTEGNVYESWIYAQGTTNRALKDLETEVDALKVRSFVLKTKPYVAVEIGKKQGLYTDQRYLVYRKTLMPDGQEGRKRVGTLRVAKVGDNTDKFQVFREKKAAKDTTNGIPATLGDLFKSIRQTDQTSKTSTSSTKKEVSPSRAELKHRALDSLMSEDLRTMSIFKQVDGVRIEPYDLVEQNEDEGIGFQVGYGTRLDAPALILGADLRLSALLKGRMPVAGIKFGVNMGFPDKKMVSDLWNLPEDQTTLWDIYLARDLYLSPKFDLRPLAGVSIFGDAYHLLTGLTGYINIVGRNSNTKVKLAPEISYVFGYTLQSSLNLRFEF